MECTAAKACRPHTLRSVSHAGSKFSHSSVPTPLCLCVGQYDFVELLDGSRLISKDKRALSGREEEQSGGGARSARSVNVHEAGFIQYLDTGIWHKIGRAHV